MTLDLLLYIVIMAGTIYLIRMLPLVVFRKKIQSRFIKSLLFYIPYTVLSAMTFPAILYATGSMVSAFAGLVVALILALMEKSLITVSVAACVTAYIALVIGF